MAGLLAGCGTQWHPADAATAATLRRPRTLRAANTCIDVGATASLCTSNPSLPSVTDLSGTWVLETIGAQVVTTPAFTQPFHLKSINVILVQVAQTGSDVTLSAELLRPDPARRSQATQPRSSSPMLGG